MFVQIPLVDQIRPRVKAWRDAGDPGVTAITGRLLEHWRDLEQRPEGRRSVCCQSEAAETLIWLPAARPWALLDLPPSSYCCAPVPVSEEDRTPMRLLDEQYTATPYAEAEVA